jgi:ERCC4-type nuclease
MIIKIDIREHDLLAKCKSTIEAVIKFKDIQIISEQLPLGDIIINDGNVDCLIIERKTLSDLGASIKDGRYEEQSYRLNGLNHHNHNIIYLIEGDMYRFNTFRERIDKQTLYSAMFSINYFKGFSVMRTNTLEETAMVVCNMVYKIVGGMKAGKLGYYSIKQNANDDVISLQDNNTNNNTTTENTEIENISNDNSSTNKDYCSVIKKVKKENITQDNIGEIMLCQIPGVSSSTALAILQKFKTLPNVIKCIQEEPTCLNEICTVDSKGKSRKISKSAIATIVKFLNV